MRRPLLPGFLPAVLTLLLAGCAARFESFPFVTAAGDRVEIRQSPGRSREQEAVFAPTSAHLTSPVYSLRTSVEITAPRQAFVLSYGSSLPDCKLTVLSDRKTSLRSVQLPPSGGSALRFLVPLGHGEKIWGYQLSAMSPAAAGQVLHLIGAGTGPFVHGFTVTPDGLSVDGSVELAEIGPDGAKARITRAALREMAQGIWEIRIGISADHDQQDRHSTIRFSSGVGSKAVFSVDETAGIGSLSFARGSVGFLPRDVSAELPVTSFDISLLPADRPIPADPGMILWWDRATWRRPDFEVYFWDRFPNVLIFDTATYAVQDDMFKRLAFFVEKTGYRGTIEDPAALQGRHGYNAHDYRAEDLARFFTEAARQGLSLTSGEAEVEQILEASDLIRRTPGGFAPG
ncbi:MAG TPA: hypothetical protein VMU36_08210, partial [Spirochaetia bacterium]|nr:hypothetical protein [Spirochaetia bacterium]